ncbi:Hypothetical_protein [Hexamita inflata]|uniref:Hypothetical_protein n=1 Tax=Hexamita inflata TaxID=28002 RepID=A0AA86U1C7_9EUKA|nr:Hypothetical protein HINF_LOCUS15153 [Hexamita inflata]CAI9927511.1 Hypothetical protein HINF_LOCUS15156 [Hexamita inflata]CAI9927514.1 Hypothetical protein HINF_LOCUS15159 [Hexamita inflata]CAI9927515.1 Hypothetical protein HINF_LOCUS15160 [Hexamita inflata]
MHIMLEARDRNVKLDLTNVRTSEDLYQEAVRIFQTKIMLLANGKIIKQCNDVFDALSQRCTIVKVVTLAKVDTVCMQTSFEQKLQNIVDCTMKNVQMNVRAFNASK